MADRPEACTALREDAAELALGVLEGPERGAALAHLAACDECRALVRELTDVVDRVVALAPEAEPPPGFETTVVDRIRPVRPVAPRRRLVLAGAAAVLLAVGTLIGAQLADGGGDEAGLEWASMVAPDGEEVGEVWRYGDDDATLVVSVPAWADVPTGGPRYALRVELAGGETTELGDFVLGDGRSSWGVTTDLDADAITAVSVVDDTGRVWCTGQFA